MDLSGFGGNFTATLAANAVQHAVSFLSKGAVGDSEASALTKVLQIALTQTIEKVQTKDILESAVTNAEIAGILEQLLNTGSVAKALVFAALNGEGDAERLSALAFDAGLDPKTLPFDWEEFLMAFLYEIERAVRDEVNTSDSKLRSRVATSDLFRLRCSVTSIAEHIDRAIERLTGGLIEVDPTDRFNDFLLEYLGRPDHPKPFGGRQKDIEALNDWFEEPEGSPKLLLVAPAGRGKSALLVHWVRQLPRDIATVFIPVSTRFQTSQAMTFLPALASRLAHLHGKTVPGQTRLDLDRCRSLAAYYMKRPLPDNRRLLVVVDGLDEAGDRYSWAGQFPDDMPDSVRYVASARQLGGDRNSGEWMSRVGWDSFPERVRLWELAGLTVAGIAEVLQRMGIPLTHAAASGGVAVNIHDLTKGDPLLVGLYAEQLWRQYRQTGRLIWDETELRKFKEGLRGFFDKWYAGQLLLWGEKRPLVDRQVRGILIILSQALGPLQSAELRELMRRAFQIEDWSLGDAMEPLNRFVIGDGKDAGYALSHPRLNEFFGEEPFCDQLKRDMIQKSILAWGEETLGNLECGRLRPDRAPAYLLAHLGEHYAAGGVSLETFSKLLSEGWISSWRISDPTFRGFLGDVQRVWDRANSGAELDASSLRDSELGIQFRCMLYFGSIGSQYRLPGGAIFAAAKDTGVITARQILSIIAYRVDANDFEQVVDDIAPAIARECGAALASLLELRAASLIKVQLLAKIAGYLTDHERALVVDKARRAARERDDPFERVCSALTLLRFTRSDKKHREIKRIVEGLATFNETRLSPETLNHLIDEAPEAAGRLSRGMLARYFSLAAYEKKDTVQTLFALQSEAHRRELIEMVLARPIEYFLAEQGDALAVVSPWLDELQKANLFARVSERPFRDQMIVLSKLGVVFDAARQSSFFKCASEELSRAISLGNLVFVDWASFLNRFDEPYKDHLLRALANAVSREIGSSAGLTILAQIVSLFNSEQKQFLAAKALAEGPRNHDEVPCLRLLGECLDFMTEEERSPRRSRLAERIAAFLDSKRGLDETSRLSLSPDLLPYMTTEAARLLAVDLIRAWAERNPKTVSWLPKIIPFLPEPHRTAATEKLRQIILDSDKRIVNNHLLEEAQMWLPAEDFHDLFGRLLEEARRETNLRQRSMELASLLEFAGREIRRDLSAFLMAETEHVDDLDDLWVNVISRVIEVEEPEWILENAFSSILRVQRISRTNCIRLICELSRRVGGSKAIDLLSYANAILPLERWPHRNILSAIPLLDREGQITFTIGVLRDLSKVGRVKQLSVMSELLPILANVGGSRAITLSWESLWDATRIWP